MKFWWVNQNQTYKSEVQGGFLWSPKTKKNGVRNQFYTNMTLVKSGDVVFSFADTRIKAIGRILASAETAPKPNFGTAGGYWRNEGWHVPVEFTELQNVIRPKDIIGEIAPHLLCKRVVTDYKVFIWLLFRNAWQIYLFQQSVQKRFL